MLSALAPWVASLATALILGCGQPFWNPPPPPPEPKTPAPSSAAQITSIDLERTACLGTCAHYRIQLREDGSASYSGLSDTLLGVYQGVLDTNAYRRLAGEVLRNGFFDLPTDLGVSLDAPVTIVTVTVRDPGTRTKLARGDDPDYHYLWPLARRIDSLAATLPWQLISRR